MIAAACVALATFAPRAALADEPKTAAPAAPPPNPEDAPASPDESPALVLGAVALASFATAGVFGVLAWQDHETFLAHPDGATADRGKWRAFTADMCFASGTVFAILSAALFVRPEPDASNGGNGPPPNVNVPRVSFAPYISPTGGGASALLKW